MTDDRILATYRIETAHPIEFAAEVMAGEQSCGTFVRLPGETDELRVNHAARKAGIRTSRIQFAVYVISGFCAALGGLVSIAQLGAVSPSFGNQREFAAIAAAVLGGTSLFGGRGAVLPGTLLGALLIQTIENGLVIANADPYLYPLVMSVIIFLAVLLDSLRNKQLRRSQRRIIRPAG
jgi:ribose/xylose/arabinose/galactoside ABC-type transport system permease subunit